MAANLEGSCLIRQHLAKLVDTSKSDWVYSWSLGPSVAKWHLLQCRPMYFSEVSPAVLSGAYSLENVARIVVRATV